jgi:SCY1-like protein 2
MSSFFQFNFRPVFANPKSIQASVTLMEKLPFILEKSSEDDMRTLILPLLFNALESKMSQIQVFYSFRN